MKKLIFLFAVLAMTLATGCKKETSNPETLNNTTWGYSGTDSNEMGNTAITATLKFEATAFSMSITFTDEDGDADTQVKRGSYVYADPNLTLIPSDPMDIPVSGIVDGDKIAFDDEDMMNAVFTRQ